ncbi:MAG: hypothetical protein Q4Q03_00195 [Bowdeniella nasicola]|nr:hypothetical protein [Bowdeniella nasicola]
MRLPRGRENVPERHRALMFFWLSVTCLYFTVVNQETMRAQLQLDAAPWAPAIAMVWWLSAPVLTITTATALWAERRMLPVRVRELSALLADLSCWWGAAYTLVLCLVSIGLYLATGQPLFSWHPGGNISTPFPLLTFIISVIYALLLGFRYIISLVAVQSIIGAYLAVSTGSDSRFAMADLSYGFVFSAVIIGAIFILLNGLVELDENYATTVTNRLEAFELDTQVEQTRYMNALLHDNVISVAVAVRNGFTQARHEIRREAGRALRVLDQLCQGRTTTDPNLAGDGHRDISERQVGEPLAMPGTNFTLQAWLLRVRTIARSEGFDFAPQGLLARLALSGVWDRYSRWRRGPVLVISQRAALAGIEAMREAIRNAHRYAKAHHHRISVRVQPWGNAHVSIRIDDDGVGFRTDPNNFGFGLRNSIIARIEHVGGRVHISSAPTVGCTITLFIPLLDAQSVTAPVRGAVHSTPQRSPEQEFSRYARSWRVRAVFLAMVPVLWLHVVVCLMLARDVTMAVIIGVSMTLLFLRISLWPASTPPRGYQITAIAAGIILPAMSLSVLPTSPHPSQGTFVYPFLVIVQLWLWVRGCWPAALISFLATTTSFIAASYHYGFAAPMPWDVVFRNSGTVVFIILYVTIMKRVYRRIQNELDSQDYLRQRQAARQRVLAGLQEQARAIDEKIRPFFTAITTGADPDKMRAEAGQIEGFLRDSIRGKRLNISPLKELIASARTRGAVVELVDDSDGYGDLTRLITAASAVMAKAGRDQRVQVRALPPKNHDCGTILFSDADGVIEQQKIARPGRTARRSAGAQA